MRGKSPRTSKSSIKSASRRRSFAAAGKQPDGRRMAYPNLTTKFFEQLLEPAAGHCSRTLPPPAGRQTDDRSGELLPAAVLQLQPLYLSISVVK